MTMREEFEKWASDDGEWKKAITRSGSGYLLNQTQSYWLAWQTAYIAGQKAMRERAATPDFHRKYVECKIIRALPIEGEE